LSAEKEILSRADAWQRAIEARDPAAAAGYLADDFALVVTNPEQAVMPREEWLRVLSDYDVRSYDIHHREISVRAGVGVVLQRVTMTAVVVGADRSGTFVLVDLWSEEDGAWRVWRRHSTPLSAGPLPRSGGA
jgi:ketosteroid isomerase-like protein